MKLNGQLIRAAFAGALAGLLFGFDTAVISGTTDSLVRVYGLSPSRLGVTVAIALVGTVISAISAGVVGQDLGGRTTLRLTAALYIVSAIGSCLALNWPTLLVARFIGGLAIGAAASSRTAWEDFRGEATRSPCVAQIRAAGPETG